MEVWGVSLTWQGGLPGGTGVGGNYVWCLVIVDIFMGLGEEQRGGERGGFKVII